MIDDPMGGLDAVDKILAELEDGVEGDFLNDKASKIHHEDINFDM